MGWFDYLLLCLHGFIIKALTLDSETADNINKSLAIVFGSSPLL